MGQHLVVHGAGISVPIANEIQVIRLASLMGLLYELLGYPAIL